MDEPRTCASCDIQLGDIPFIADGYVYCCRGCAKGGPCVCTYVNDSARYSTNGHSDLQALDLYDDVS
jgi:hypothetical protein